MPRPLRRSPVIPGLNDHEVSDVLAAAGSAGAMCAGYNALRLPYAVKELFVAWLEQHYPDRKERVLSRVREMRGGNLNGTEFGVRMRGEGEWADVFAQLFRLARQQAGMVPKLEPLSHSSFRRPGGSQQSLFD